MKKAIASTLIAVAVGGAGAALVAAPAAEAVPFDVGCETMHWGIWGPLGLQRRTVCDGPIQPDGGWRRARVIWTPAHYVPVSCYSGTYTSSCSGGYSVEETIQENSTYVVYPFNVLPGEPGHLMGGTDVTI